MGLWSFYFLTKLYWHEKGFIQIDSILNFLFLVFILWPVPERLKQNKLAKHLRNSANFILALVLLWYESRLPSFSKSISFFEQGGLSNFDLSVRFIYGLFDPKEGLILAIIFILCFFANRNKIRLASVTILLFLIVSIQEYYQPKGEINQAVQKFFQIESKKKVHFENNNDQSEFDIIILHICSLSWDDLKGIGLENDSFFNQFDYLLSNFNSVTTYSAPSAIRLLRAPCGQQPDTALYQNAGDDCYLVDILRRKNYEPFYLLNHDGKFAAFSFDVQKFGHLPDPIQSDQLLVQGFNFDGSAVHDDYAVLENGWTIREKSKAAKAVLYYNTISLHEGTRGYENKEWLKRSRIDQYKSSVIKLFSDLTKFIHLVEKSGKNSVILFVPEHGTALRGSGLQPTGLREIPIPQITIVPVGIRFAGTGHLRSKVQQHIISHPTSYFSLAYFLSQFMDKNPFEKDFKISPGLDKSVPQTDFFSENDQMRIIKIDQGYYLSSKGKEWTKVAINASDFERPESKNEKVEK